MKTSHLNPRTMELRAGTSAWGRGRAHAATVWSIWKRAPGGGGAMIRVCVPDTDIGAGGRHLAAARLRVARRELAELVARIGKP